MDIELSDAELRKELTELGEKNIPPITEVTRNILKKKLNHLKVKAKRQSMLEPAGIQAKVSQTPELSNPRKRGRGRPSIAVKASEETNSASTSTEEDGGVKEFFVEESQRNLTDDAGNMEELRRRRKLLQMKTLFQRTKIEACRLELQYLEQKLQASELELSQVDDLLSVDVEVKPVKRARKT